MQQVTKHNYFEQGFSVELKSPYQNKRTYHPLTPLAATFNFIVLMAGTSLVATPSSFGLTTPPLGIVIEVVLGVLNWFAAICIFNAASHSNATSFIDCGRRVFGQTAKGHFINTFLITLPIIIVLVGALGGYIIIAATTFEDYIDIDRTLIRFILTLVAAILGTIKTFDNTKYISYPTFFAFFIIVSFILATTFQFYGKLPEPTTSSFKFHLFIQGLPILALGLNGHMALPGMAAEMKKSKHHTMFYYLLVGQFIMVTFNSAIGFFPSILYGNNVESNIMTQLNNTYQLLYGTYSSLLLAANIMLSIAVIIQAPLLVIPLKEIALDRKGISVRERSYLTNALASLTICFLSGSIAIFIPDLNTALNSVASIGSLIITGPAPALLSLYTENTLFSKTRSWIIMVSGIILLICNFYTIYVSFAPQD